MTKKRKSNRKPLTRKKRPLVRLAQPKEVPKKAIIPVDKLRTTKVVWITRKRFFFEGTPPKVEDKSEQSELIRKALMNPFVKAAPVYDRESLRRQILKNIGGFDHHEEAVVFSVPARFR